MAMHARNQAGCPAIGSGCCIDSGCCKSCCARPLPPDMAPAYAYSTVSSGVNHDISYMISIMLSGYSSCEKPHLTYRRWASRVASTLPFAPAAADKCA